MVEPDDISDAHEQSTDKALLRYQHASMNAWTGFCGDPGCT